jgi:hypothetical protein
MSGIRTPISVAVMMLVAVVSVIGAQHLGDYSTAESDVYFVVFRTVIEQRLANDRREGLAFFLSLRPADSVAPEARKFLLRDAPPEILKRLSDAGLPVRPGSQAAQPQPKQEVVDSKTMLPGVRVVLNRVTWASEAEALVYCESYGHGKDGEGKLLRLRHHGGEWSIVSVDPKWKS